MALKQRGVEPTVSAVIAQCPKAALNPQTGVAFTAPSIAKVFRTQCYDVKADEPWAYTTPCQKTALPPAIIEARSVWAREIQKLNHSDKWYFRNCIWLDPCSTVIPAARRTVFDQQQAAKGTANKLPIRLP